MLFILYFTRSYLAIISDGNPPSLILEQASPTLAFVYLGIAVFGWIAFFTYAWWKIHKGTFGTRNGIRQLGKTGKLINAKILTVTTKKSVEDQEIEVSFDNFSGTRIPYTLLLTDTKPHLKRYEKGKYLKLRVDPDLKYLPYVIPHDAEVKLKHLQVIALYCLWAIALLGITGYFAYAYTSENQGYGWRFLSLQHPLIMSLIVMLGLGLVYHFLIDKLFLSKIGGLTIRKARELLFHGVQTTAMVLQVHQTGMYTNEQPEIKFDLTFVDKKGVKHQVSIKKTVALINLQSVHQTAKSIFYLPHSPTTVAFEEDLKIS